MMEELDAELARWLRARTTLRAMRDRDPSALDDVAFALRRLRAKLGAMTAADGSTATRRIVSLTYRWAVRIARELEAIEQQQLDATSEWALLERFAPFATAFHDRALAAALGGGRAMEMTQLRCHIDAVLAPLELAMTSSRMAA
jgi:hypothetical protein